MKKPLLVLSLFCISSFFSVGCSTHETDNDNERNFFDGFFRNDPYGTAFQKMTQTKMVQGGFENYFEAVVTFWNLELRKSFVQEMSRVYRMSESETQVLESGELKENDDYYTFIVSSSSRESRWRELDRSDALWRLSLENADGTVRVRPERTVMVSAKDDRWQFFYRSMNRFNKTYRVRFPKKDLATSSKLVHHIAGPLGGISMSFDADVAEPIR